MDLRLRDHAIHEGHPSPVVSRDAPIAGAYPRAPTCAHIHGGHPASRPASSVGGLHGPDQQSVAACIDPGARHPCVAGIGHGHLSVVWRVPRGLSVPWMSRKEFVPPSWNNQGVHAGHQSNHGVLIPALRSCAEPSRPPHRRASSGRTCLPMRSTMASCGNLGRSVRYSGVHRGYSTRLPHDIFGIAGLSADQGRWECNAESQPR